MLEYPHPGAKQFVFSSWRQIVWLPDEDIQALNDVANHADITVSTYIHMLLDATKFAMPNRALKDIYLKFFDFLEKQA